MDKNGCHITLTLCVVQWLINKLMNAAVARSSFANAAPSAPASNVNVSTIIVSAEPVSQEALSKMNPRQVGQLMKSHGASDDTVSAFEKNEVAGQVIVDGITDDDLKEMGFTSGIKRRGILSMLQNFTLTVTSAASTGTIFILR